MALIITQFHLSPSASIQKRLKKEKKAKRKLQEALEFESKRRERVEDALKHSSSSSPSPEPLHAANNNTNSGTTGCLLVCLLPFCLTSRSHFCFHIFYCSLGFLTLLFVLLGFQSAVTVFCFYCFSLDSFCCIFANQTFLFSLHRSTFSERFGVVSQSVSSLFLFSIFRFVFEVLVSCTILVFSCVSCTILVFSCFACFLTDSLQLSFCLHHRQQ